MAVSEEAAASPPEAKFTLDILYLESSLKNAALCRCPLQRRILDPPLITNVTYVKFHCHLLVSVIENRPIYDETVVWG